MPYLVKSLFENTIKNPFFYFLKSQPKLYKKKLEKKYGHSHFKSASRIDFQLWEVVKLKIRKHANLRIFSLTTS